MIAPVVSDDHPAPGKTRENSPLGIDYFNRSHPLHRVKEYVALRARKRMYQRCVRIGSLENTSRILDVGVTPDIVTSYNNFFERWYPHRERLTICSIEDCSNLEACFRGITFKRIEGQSLPFRDDEFDVAVSFAVLEHVGPRAAQEDFLRELARVARQFVIYTPYRYFPIEMHTLVPLVHWLPAKIYRSVWNRLGLTFWADERNLNLLTVSEVRRLLPSGGTSRVRLLWTCGWPSNLEVHWRRDRTSNGSPQTNR